LSARLVQTQWNIEYLENKKPRSCTATAMVNAAGPWANEILARIKPLPPILAIELVQGTHLVLDIPALQGVYYLEARDARAVFVMPWRGRTLIGTTETPFEGDPARVTPTSKEIEYLKETYRHYFPRKEIRLVESFAGLRVLPAANGAPFYRSRETVFHAGDSRPPRMLTIYGGKLTGYRLTAERALRRLRPVLPERIARADTAALPLRDAD
jgi:glycerol-3-phosphate dehydrogenase